MHLYDLMASYTRVSSFCTANVPPTFTPKIKPYNPSSTFLWQKYKYISWKNRPLFSLGSITIFYDLSIIFYIGFALNKRLSVSLAKSFLALPLAAFCHFPFDQISSLLLFALCADIIHYVRKFCKNGSSRLVDSDGPDQDTNDAIILIRSSNLGYETQQLGSEQMCTLKLFCVERSKLQNKVVRLSYLPNWVLV